MAQLIDSPTTFHIQPMQIDTKNRFYNGTDFKPGVLPRSSTAPPNASYSGLLESFKESESSTVMKFAKNSVRLLDFVNARQTPQ